MTNEAVFCEDLTGGVGELLPEIFDSLDSLKVASNSLLPPFKTVRLQNEPLLQGFAVKSANKSYTQSQTILVTKEINSKANGLLDCRIREIIPQKDQPAKSLH